MIPVLATLTFAVTVLALIYFLPDLRKFIKATLSNAVQGIGVPDYSFYLLSVFCAIVFGGLGLLFFKLSLSLVAYVFSDDLLEYFVQLRGVFTVEEAERSPLKTAHIIVGMLLMPAIQLLTVFIVYSGMSSFMAGLNRRFGQEVRYTRKTGFFLILLSVSFYAGLDILLYTQNIPIVREVAHLTYLGLSKCSVLVFFFGLCHVHYLNDSSYADALSDYLDIHPWVKRIVYSPIAVILMCYLVAVLLNLPFYSGVQFSGGNLQVFLAFVFSCLASFMILKLIFAKAINYIGVVLLDSGDSPIPAALAYTKTQLIRSLAGMGILLMITVLVSLKAVFVYVVAVVCLLLVLSLLGAVVLFFSHSLFEIHRFIQIALVKRGSEGRRSDWSFNFRGMSRTFTVVMRACLPGILSVSALFTLSFFVLTVFPKTFIFRGDSCTNAVVDPSGNVLYHERTRDNSGIGIPFDELPPFMVKCLVSQEDRGFFDQNAWLPNLSNWHGISLAAGYRFYHGGGGSNINQQLLKNLVFKRIFPQDIQRKLTEVLASYQLSIQSAPESTFAQYCNTVSFHDGAGHSGIMAASAAVFGRALSDLNELEQLYLVYSLKRGSGIMTERGLISFKEVPYHEAEVKEQLLNVAEYRYGQGLLAKQELNKMKRQRLRFVGMENPIRGAASSNAFLKEQIRVYEDSATTFFSSIDQNYQEGILQAVKQFPVKLDLVNRKSDFALQSAVIVADIRTGKILGHYGGEGVTDLTGMGYGNPMASLIKPFVILELLEQGHSRSQLKLYDGQVLGMHTPRNPNGKYTNEFLSSAEILSRSNNACMVNIRQITNTSKLYGQVESRFGEMFVKADPQVNPEDITAVENYQLNYPLGMRRMRLIDIAQIYQTLFNQGGFVELTAFQGYFRASDNEYREVIPKNRQVYDRKHAEWIMKDLIGVFDKGGTAYSLRSELPPGKRFYGKTGTSEGAKHGYMILSDGDVLVAVWVSYCQDVNGRIECNNTPAIPSGSGSKSAGLLAAMVYQNIQSQ